MTNKQKTNRHTKRTNRVMLYMLYALVVTSLVTTVTLSRYKTTLAQTESIGGATVYSLVNPDDSGNFTITDLPLPGETREYHFNIVNFNGENVSSMNQTYTVTLSTTGNLPLTFTLQGAITQGSGTVIAPEATLATMTGGTQTFSGGAIEHTVSTAHAYTLTIAWPAEQNDHLLSYEIDEITVSIVSQQTDVG